MEAEEEEQTSAFTDSPFTPAVAIAFKESWEWEEAEECEEAEEACTPSISQISSETQSNCIFRKTWTPNRLKSIGKHFLWHF